MLDLKTELIRINVELAQLRDELHDAKLGGDADDVATIEKHLKDAKERKDALLKRISGGN